MQSHYVPLCRHIKTNGRVCRSAALVDSAFCFHHQKLRGTRRRTLGSGPGLSTNVLYPLRNAGTIQKALSMVASEVAAGRLHPKRAHLMLQAIRGAMKLNQTR
jgi:hypothetical protein